MALHCGSSRTIRATRSWKAFSRWCGGIGRCMCRSWAGEPLIRYRELEALLPQPDRMNIEVQLVTSAVRPIPAHWAALGCLHLVVSIGRPARAPRYTAQARATYDRILRNITGHQVIVHCTVTAQLLERATYLDDFAAFWSEEWLGLRVS